MSKAGLSDRFFRDLVAMGIRRRTDPAVWLAVWCYESGLQPSAVNAKGGARGLNQMMPSTLRALKAPANFEELDGAEQLPWIEMLIAQGERQTGGPFTSRARYYHSNFYPATLSRGSSPATIVVAGDATDAREVAAYNANKGLDLDQDGRITLADLEGALARAHCNVADRLAQAAEEYASPTRVGVTLGAVATSVLFAAFTAWRLS